MYQTGSIVKARVNKYPFIHHYGIVLATPIEPVIVHFSPNGSNEFGGSLFIHSFDKFTATRQIETVVYSPLNYVDIEKGIEEYKCLRFDVLNRNCEHFIYKLTTGKEISPQLMKFIIIVLVITTLIILIKKKNKI